MKPVAIYTSPYCPFCRAAKALLNGKNIPFKEINVEGDDEKRKWLVETTGQQTVPQIFIGDKSIGGFQELEELENNGKLDDLLK